MTGLANCKQQEDRIIPKDSPPEQHMCTHIWERWAGLLVAAFRVMICVSYILFLLKICLILFTISVILYFFNCVTADIRDGGIV